MLYSKGLRTAVYILMLVVFSSVAILSWVNTAPADASSFAPLFIASGLFVAVYGWLFVRRVMISIWSIHDEDALKLARGMCFEMAAILILVGIVFSLRH